MRAAIALRDVVGETQHIFIIAVVPFQRDLDADAVTLGRNGDGVGQQGHLVAIEIGNECANAALVIEVVFLDLLVAPVAQQNADARIEEGQLAIAVFQLLEIELQHILEGFGAGHEGDAGALFNAALAVRRGITHHAQRFHRIAMGKFHPVFLAIAPDGQLQPFRQGVHHGNADAMQPARDLVGVVVAGVLEFAAGVQLGHDDLGGGNPLLGVDAGGNAAPVILNRDRAIGVQLDQHQIAMPGQRLVDGVVGYLEHHVVQARAIVGIANIHAGALAHRVEALEDLDRIRAIGVGIGRVGIWGAGACVGGRVFGFDCHAQPIALAGSNERVPNPLHPQGNPVEPGWFARFAGFWAWFGAGPPQCRILTAQAKINHQAPPAMGHGTGAAHRGFRVFAARHRVRPE